MPVHRSKQTPSVRRCTTPVPRTYLRVLQRRSRCSAEGPRPSGDRLRCGTGLEIGKLDSEGANPTVTLAAKAAKNPPGGSPTTLISVQRPSLRSRSFCRVARIEVEAQLDALPGVSAKIYERSRPCTVGPVRFEHRNHVVSVRWMPGRECNRISVSSLRPGSTPRTKAPLLRTR